MVNMDDSALARKRALVIMKVRSGRMTATEGARELGVSRKTYYQWEKRALSGLMDALKNGASGRPSKPIHTEEERLREQVKALEDELELTREMMKLRELVRDLKEIEAQERRDRMEAKKKPGQKQHKRSSKK
jgi:transposase